jgi:hypothetical protein
VLLMRREERFRLTKPAEDKCYLQEAEDKEDRNGKRREKPRETEGENAVNLVKDYRRRCRQSL